MRVEERKFQNWIILFWELRPHENSTIVQDVHRLKVATNVPVQIETNVHEVVDVWMIGVL